MLCSLWCSDRASTKNLFKKGTIFMTEEDKQATDQQKKPAKKQQDSQGKSAKSQPKQAGMSTDPEAMKDEGYQKRIEEKTSKH
jgi:hypothetical protein